MSFLDDIWGDVEGTVFIATQNNGKWRTTPIEWPLNKLMVNALIKSSKGDIYFTPAIFESGSENPTQENFLYSNVCWADIDKPDDHTPVANLVVASGGTGNKHLYWRGKYANREELESANRSLAYGISGADTGAWNCNKYLRVPETTNYKYDQPRPVKLIGQHPDANFPALSQEPTDNGRVGDEIKLTRLDAEYALFQYPLPDKLITYLNGTFPDDRSKAFYEVGLLCREAGMNRNETFSVLHHLHDRWGKYGERADKELTRIVSKCYEHEASKRRSLHTFSSVLQHEGSIEFLVKDIVTEQGITVLTGPPGVGKTQFSLNLAFNLAIGESSLFLKGRLSFPRRAKTLYISLEMSVLELKLFMEHMHPIYEDTVAHIDEHFTLYAPGESIALDREEGQNELLELIQETEPELIMIDTLGSAISGELTDERIIRPTMDFLDRVRHRYGCAIWINHHQRKASAENKKPTKLSDLYGSQYIGARASSVLCLYPVSSESIEVSTLKNRYAAVNGKYEIGRTKNLMFYISNGGPEPEDKGESFEPPRATPI